MSRLRFRPAARADIAGIYEFSRQRWGIARAEAYVEQIDAAIRGALERPARAPEAHSPFRHVRAGSHLIFYRIEHDGIMIVRVLHQRMDVRSRLG